MSDVIDLANQDCCASSIQPRFGFYIISYMQMIASLHTITTEWVSLLWIKVKSAGNSNLIDVRHYKKIYAIWFRVIFTLGCEFLLFLNHFYWLRFPMNKNKIEFKTRQFFCGPAVLFGSECDVTSDVSYYRRLVCRQRCMHRAPPT